MSHSIKNLIKNAEKVELTGEQMELITEGKCRIVAYEELEKCQTIDACFAGKEGLIILYQKTNNNGHWTLIYKENNNTLNFLPNNIKNGYKILSLTGPWIYTKVLLPYIINNINDCIIYNTNALDGFYNGYILYDGTNGEYHKKEHSKKKHYLDLKEKIIL